MIKYSDFLLAITLHVILFACTSHAEVPAELVIGVPAFNSDQEFYSSPEIAHKLMRSAVTTPLLRAKAGADKGAFSLILADSFQTNSDLTRWSYRIRNSIIFPNGKRIQAGDVCDSLLKCEALQKNNKFLFDRCEVRSSKLGDNDSDWIDIFINRLPEIKFTQQNVIESFAVCPIFEMTSRKIFAADFAHGANFISVGDYRLMDFQANKSYLLERFQKDKLGRSVARQQIELRSFNHMREALTALRVGTIGMFYNTDSEIAKTATDDETLRILSCGQDQVIYRRGFQFDCTDGIKLSSVVWELP